MTRIVALAEMDHGRIVDMLKHRKREALRIVNHHDPKMVKTPERQTQRHVANMLQELIDKLEAAKSVELPLIEPRQIFTMAGEPMKELDGECFQERDKDFVNDNIEAAAILLEAVL